MQLDPLVNGAEAIAEKEAELARLREFQRQRVVEYHALGVPVAQLARQARVTRSTIYQWIGQK